MLSAYENVAYGGTINHGNRAAASGVAELSTRRNPATEIALCGFHQVNASAPHPLKEDYPARTSTVLELCNSGIAILQGLEDKGFHPSNDVTRIFTGSGQVARLD